MSRAEPLTIRAMAAHVPSAAQTLAEAAAEIGLNGMQVRMFGRLFGLERLPYDPGESLETLLVSALDALASQDPAAIRRVRYVIHTHTIPAVRPAFARIGLNLPQRIETLSLTMAHCASGLVALEMLDDLLISGETAIILAGEKAFHPRVRVIQDTTVMSDGAVALLVGRGEGRIAVRATHAIHDGRFAISRGHRGEEPALPDNYVGFVGAHIRAALTRFGLAPGDLRLILPHNVNLVSWGAIAKTLGLPLTAVYTRNIPRYGHCFGADPLLNLMDAEADGLLAPGDRALCVSVGMGMSAAATLIDILPAPVPASIPAQRKDLSPCS